MKDINPSLIFVMILVVILLVTLLVKISNKEQYIPDYSNIPNSLAERYYLTFDNYYIRIYVDKESGYMYLHNKSSIENDELVLLKDINGNPL